MEEVRAEHLVIGPEAWFGLGVTLVRGEDRLEAASLSGSPEAGLRLVDGRWTRGSEGWQLQFASLDLVGERAEAHMVRWTGPDGAWVEAQAALWDGQTLRLVEATLHPCGCEAPEPWSIEVGEVRWRPDPARPDVLILQRPGLRVLGLPPLPGPPLRLPLERRSGLLAPWVGQGADGWRFEQPVYWVLGEPADLTLTPSWRQARGWRGLGEARWATPTGAGQLHGSLGPDMATQTWRGGLGARIEEEGLLAFAAAGEVWSDPEQVADYGETFATRGQRYPEQRVVLGRGAFDLATLAAQQPGQQQLLGGSWTLAEAPLPLGSWATGRLVSAALVDPEGAWLGGEGAARMALRRPTPWGPLVLSPGLRGRLGASSLEPLAPSGAPLAEVRLPLIRPGARGVQRLEPALKGSWTPDGPRGASELLWRRTHPDGTQELRGGGAIGPAGPAVRGSAWSGGEALAGFVRGQWRADRAGFSAGGQAQQGPVEIQLGLWSQDEPLGRAGLALSLPASLRVEAGWRAPLASPWPGWSRTFGLGWQHPTGCVGLGLGAQLDADRGAPDFALRLTVAP